MAFVHMAKDVFSGLLADFNGCCCISSYVVRMNTLPLVTCWHVLDVIRQLSGCLGMALMCTAEHMYVCVWCVCVCKCVCMCVCARARICVTC